MTQKFFIKILFSLLKWIIIRAILLVINNNFNSNNLIINGEQWYSKMDIILSTIENEEKRLRSII